MKKIIREVDEKRGIHQITVADERWYLKSTKDEATSLPIYKPVPSVTWIAGFWPKGIGFYKWLADKGWDEAEAAKQAAGDKGSRVHLAIERILRGEEFRIDTPVLDKNRSTEQEIRETELSYEELLCVKSFIDWRDEVKPEVIATETTVFSEKECFAGTVDLVCRINGVPYIIDFKTSKQVWKEYELQVSAYRFAIENGENPIHEKNPNGTDKCLFNPVGIKTAILQIGYERNKAGYKFTEVENAFEEFKLAKKIWKSEVGDTLPGFTKREFPIILSKGKEQPKEEVKDEQKPLPSVAEMDFSEASAATPVATTGTTLKKRKIIKKNYEE